MKKILYFLSFLLLLASCSGKKDDKTISIGYINWDDGIALTYLTEVILEQQGYHVVLKNADPAPIYATMARGKVDLLMDAWLPATQADYMKQYGKNLEILGKIYPDARIGLVVPDYVIHYSFSPFKLQVFDSVIFTFIILPISSLSHFTLVSFIVSV